jgi:hypothetical protein
MAPLAEKGDRSYLFAGSVSIYETDEHVSVRVTRRSVAIDLSLLHRSEEEMTIQGDPMGAVRIHGKATTEKIALPSNTIFFFRRLDFIPDKPI